MRLIILIFLILTATLSISQTKNSNIKVDVEVYPPFEKIIVKVDPIDHCKVQIIDSKKNIVKTVELPVTSKQPENTISIIDLEAGNYTCYIYKGKEELYKKDFFKDAIYAEPQPVYTPKNN